MMVDSNGNLVVMPGKGGLAVHPPVGSPTQMPAQQHPFTVHADTGGFIRVGGYSVDRAQAQQLIEDLQKAIIISAL